MTELDTRRATGLLGLAAGGLLLVEVPLYFIYPGAPPDWNILTRVLVGLLSLTLLLGFFTGLRELLRPAGQLVAGTALAAGLAWVVTELVAQSLEAGTAIAAAQPVDPTIDGPLAPGTFLLHSSIARLLCAALLIAVGYASRRAGTLPRRAGTWSYVLAAVNLAMVPALFFGSDPARFYSAEGWGTTAFPGALLSLWLLAVSASMLRRTAARPVPGRPLQHAG